MVTLISQYLSRYNSNLSQWNWKDDLLFFVIIPLIYIGCFLLPYNIKDAYFILHIPNWNWTSLFLSNYVHSEFKASFMPNLIMYYPIMFGIFAFESNKQRFYKFMAFAFLVLPFIISLVSLWSIRSGIDQGSFRSISVFNGIYYLYYV